MENGERSGWRAVAMVASAHTTAADAAAAATAPARCAYGRARHLYCHRAAAAHPPARAAGGAYTPSARDLTTASSSIALLTSAR
jgi:hypothetical protein